MTDIDFSFFEKALSEFKIELTKRQLCQFYSYYELLVSWNEKINLTAITEFEEVFIKHFLDSLSFIKVFNSYEEMVELTRNKRLCDIGTGAGFPGIPLKILLPDLNVVLFDSLDKRIRFLNEVISKLELTNIEAIHGRVEDLAHNNVYRETFDFATARAVASLPVLLEYCIPFVSKEGFFISFKSEKASDEISLSENALKILGANVDTFEQFTLPFTDLNRVLIKIKKVELTGKKYPRKAGTPTRSPL